MNFPFNQSIDWCLGVPCSVQNLCWLCWLTVIVEYAAQIYPIYRGLYGIITIQYRDPDKPTRFMEWSRDFAYCSDGNVWCMPRGVLEAGKEAEMCCRYRLFDWMATECFGFVAQQESYHVERGIRDLKDLIWTQRRWNTSFSFRFIHCNVEE